MKLKFKTQAYQTDAVRAVVDLRTYLFNFSIGENVEPFGVQGEPFARSGDTGQAAGRAATHYRLAALFGVFHR